jgi:hypothetical protein
MSALPPKPGSSLFVYIPITRRASAFRIYNAPNIVHCNEIQQNELPKQTCDEIKKPDLINHTRYNIMIETTMQS